MSIDTRNLINQYMQTMNTTSPLYTGGYQNQTDFENTLNKLISNSQSAKTLSDNINKKIASDETGDLEEIFNKAAETYDVPVELLKAMAKAESGFNTNAVSKCGAMGIMQLMPGTAKALGVVDAFDPEQNIMGGANYISQKLKAYDGDITLALAAYNAGSGNVAKYGGVPPFKETQNYIEKIIGYMGEDIEIKQPSFNLQENLNGSYENLFAANKTYSQLGTEGAYFASQMQILKHQMQMQELFASTSTGILEYDNEDSDMQFFANLLKNL